MATGPKLMTDYRDKLAAGGRSDLAQRVEDSLLRPNGSLLHQASDGLQDVGKVIGKGASMASAFLPPGFKQLASVGGSVLQGGNMADHLKAGASSLIPVPGMDKIGGFSGGSLGDIMGKVPGFDGVGDMVSGGLKKLNMGSLGDMAGSALDFAKGHPDELLAAGEGLLGAHDALKARSLRGKALGSAEGAYNERAPLRKMGIEGMTTAQAPDLSSLFADPNNPYQQPRLKRMGGA